MLLAEIIEHLHPSFKKLVMALTPLAPGPFKAARFVEDGSTFLGVASMAKSGTSQSDPAFGIELRVMEAPGTGGNSSIKKYPLVMITDLANTGPRYRELMMTLRDNITRTMREAGFPIRQMLTDKRHRIHLSSEYKV